MPAVVLEGRLLAIVPCRNKKPCCPGGFHAAVSDPDEIAALWSAYPDAPQIGVATGAVPNNLDVLDIDLHKGGDKFFKENEHRLPDTRAHRTPSGGLHLLFRHAAGLGISAGRVAEGVDVRADNGGVVWYPAHNYPVHEAPVAEWPEWLLELARPPVPQFKKGEDDALVRRPINPNDNRFVPEPLYNKIIELMRGARGINQRRVRGILRVLVETHQLRNVALRDAAIQLGTLVNIDIITRDAAEQLLFMAAEINGYVAKDGEKEAKTTIRYGLNFAMSTRGSSSPVDEKETAE